MTVRREEEGLWSIWISPNISELTDGDPLALLVEVVAPDGWRITHVTAGKGAEGLVLTCGSVTDKGGRILLDGVSTGEDAGPILLIYGEKIPLFSAEQGGYMGVTPGETPGVTPVSAYRIASSARISSSVVAQLVAKRTTVWVASGFSQ